MAEPKKSNAVAWVVGCIGLFFVGIVVIGILAAIAIPAFVNYVRRAKSAEAQSNVRAIAMGVQSYCASESALPAAIAPAFVPDAERHAVPLDPAWQSVGFSSPDPVYYAYSLERPDATRAVVVAEGDLDGDGERSRFEVTCAFDASTSECTCSPIAVTNELE